MAARARWKQGPSISGAVGARGVLMVPRPQAMTQSTAGGRGRVWGAGFPRGGGRGAREQALQLVAQRDGEAGGEDAGVAAVQLLRGGAGVRLQPGAAGGREQAGGRRVGDEGDVAF